MQRSPTMVVNIEPSAQLAYALYDEGPPLEDCDLIATSMPFALARKSHIVLTEQGKKLDKPLLDALDARGFRLDFGEDGSGWQFKYLTRGGGYYFNVGCSDLIAEGKIALAQFSDIESFVAEGARMRGGETHRGRSDRAVDRLQGRRITWCANCSATRSRRASGRSGASTTRQELRNTYVAHRAARPLVHRRQLRAVPHLFEISRPADQGARVGPV